jgi:hypothetical protein
MNQFLRIALWNANGLVEHYQETKLFITNQNIDILLVSETHFTERSFFTIPNYKLYSTEHPNNRARGGAAVLIRSNIKHYEMQKIQHDYLQASSVVVESCNGPVTISAVYCPPPYNIQTQQFNDFFTVLGSKFIAGGDFNAKHTHWGSRLITPRGRTLYKSVTEINLDFVSSGQPTYWPTDQNKIPDLLDFFIIKGISLNYLDVESSLDLSSDHTPLILTYSSSVYLKDKRQTLYNKCTNWDYFRTLVNNNINLKIPLRNENDVEESINYFNTTIQNAAWNATPNSDISVTKSNKYPIYLSTIK